MSYLIGFWIVQQSVLFVIQHVNWNLTLDFAPYIYFQNKNETLLRAAGDFTIMNLLIYLLISVMHFYCPSQWTELKIIEKLLLLKFIAISHSLLKIFGWSWNSRNFSCQSLIEVLCFIRFSCWYISCSNTRLRF